MASVLPQTQTHFSGATDPMKVTVEMTSEEFAVFSKNQIHFIVDNQTPFVLESNSTTFADWGDFASGPKTVNPFTNNGDAGHVISSKSPFTGSAGLVGYTVTLPDVNKTKIYLRLLASDPYASVRSNWAYVSILTSDESIDQPSYNKLYNDETKIARYQFQDKIIELRGHIGQADEATATFTLTFK